MVLACALALIFCVSCDQLLKSGKNSEEKQKYTLKNCVKIMLAMEGPNPDDGDRWDAEMACAPCDIGGFMACKKMIDQLTGEGEYKKDKKNDESEEY